MTFIDVAIPCIAGLLALAFPQWLARSRGDAHQDAARQQQVRVCGLVLLAVAAVFYVIK